VSAWRRGRIRTSSRIKSHIAGVTTPVALARGVFSTSFSNAHTACTVERPNTPSIGPGANFSSASRDCSMRTSSPSTPSFRSREIGGSIAATVFCVVEVVATLVVACSGARCSSTAASTTITTITIAPDTTSTRP